LSPGLKAGQIRVVLTWGKNPRDLDAHLTGPLPGGRQFEVSFRNKGDLQSKEFVNLDVDDRDGDGPETITILGVLPGTYQYKVQNFSDSAVLHSKALAQSGAEVKVYQGGQTYRFATDQSSEGVIWHACDIEVDQSGVATVRKVDQYQDQAGKWVAVALDTVVVLFDTSHEMAEAIEPTKQAIAALIDAFPFGKGARMGLVRFGEPPSQAHVFSQNSRSLKAAVAKLDAVGGRSLAGGLEIAHQMLDLAGRGRLVIVVTNGVPDHREEALAWAKRIKSTGVVILVVGIGEVDRDFLNQLASGPNWIATTTPDELTSTIRRVAAALDKLANPPP